MVTENFPRTQSNKSSDRFDRAGPGTSISESKHEFPGERASDPESN
jgi:hypothetical protein